MAIFGVVKKVSHIYMDYAAATPVDEAVLARMKKYWSEDFGNPGSIHDFGVSASRAVEQARKDVAGVLGARAEEVIFTSGGTESNNLAVLGAARAAKTREPNKKHHIIVSAIEHHSVLKSCEELACLRSQAHEGFEISYIPVGENGIVNPNDIKATIKANTILVSVMYANNEVGAIQPIKEIARIIKKERADGGVYPLFHTDACQAPGLLPIKTESLGVDLMTLSGAKIYGPKGSGILYVKKGTPISPIVFGGGQERGLRSGTPDVASIVGFAEALKIADVKREKESARLTELRDYFISKLKSGVSNAELNGDEKARLPNNVNIYFPRADAEQFVIELDVAGFAVSAGSACSSREEAPSHVLLALFGSEKRAMQSLRFTFGRNTAKKDIDALLKAILSILPRIRA